MTESDYKILDRHYLKINLFGYVLRIWNTSPKKVLEHLKHPKREPNPSLKRHNYKFANQIEVNDAEIVKVTIFSKIN